MHGRDALDGLPGCVYGGQGQGQATTGAISRQAVETETEALVKLEMGSFRAMKGDVTKRMMIRRNG